MAKVVVIDSLARSGTTLLTALLHSQERMVAYRGVFHEPLACQLGRWAKDYICRSFIVQKSLQVIEKNEQYSELSHEEWKAVFQEPVTSFADIDALYQRLAQHTRAEILCFRWNQALPYIERWLRNPDHYWVSIVRNPLSRAASHFKSHGISWDESLEYSSSFARLTKFAIERKLSRYHVLNYEDLVANPLAELTRIVEFLDHSTATLNIDSIRGQDGKQYKSETVDNIDNRGSHKNGMPTQGFYTHAIDRYKKEMPPAVIREFEDRLSREAIYQRYFND